MWQRFTLLQLALTLVSLSVFSMGLSSLSTAAQLHSQQNQQIAPIIPKDGEDAVVDYQQINTTIKNEVGKIPYPKDGENGKDAVAPPSAPTEKVDYDLINSKIEELVKKAVDKIPIPVDGRTPEFNYNRTTKQLETRFVGDKFWQPVLSMCEIINTCEAE